MENVRKYSVIKLVTIKKSIRTKLSYTKFFTENLLAREMKKTQILINKAVYLGLSMLHLSKTVMYEFWYNYVKPNAKLCYMDTDSFIFHLKPDNVYKDIAEELKKDLTLQIDRPLAKEKNKKVIGLKKNELGGQIMKKFFGLRPKTYSYLKNNNDNDKNTKGTKKCAIKRNLKFRD